MAAGGSGANGRIVLTYTASGGIPAAVASYHQRNRTKPMTILRQGTAVDVLIGPFVDKTDGATAEEGESPSVLLSKNGQALAAKSDATTPAHDDAGYYNCELDATDTDTVGTLVLVVEASANALPVRHEFQVVEEAVYDDLYAASATGYPTAAENADAVWDEATTGHTTAGTFGEQVKSDIDAILADTGTDGVVLADGAIAAAKIASEAITNAKFASGAINANTLANDTITVTKIASNAIGANEISDAAAQKVADALLDRSGAVETDVTPRQALRGMVAALLGKLSGAATTTIKIRDTNDSKDVITATVDEDGNRSAVTLDLS